MISVTERMKEDLFLVLQSVIAGKKLSKKDLQNLLKTSQPRVSDLTRGKLSKFSVEKLIEYLHVLGAETQFKIKYGNANFHLKAKEGK